jgi:hypothetical protein
LLDEIKGSGFERQNIPKFAQMGEMDPGGCVGGGGDLLAAISAYSS